MPDYMSKWITANTMLNKIIAVYPLFYPKRHFQYKNLKILFSESNFVTSQL